MVEHKFKVTLGVPELTKLKNGETITILLRSTETSTRLELKLSLLTLGELKSSPSDELLKRMGL